MIDYVEVVGCLIVDRLGLVFVGVLGQVVVRRAFLQLGRSAAL